MRKLSAVFDIAYMITDDVINMEDLEKFSDEFKGHIKFVVEENSNSNRDKKG
jgi:hypothetical protein